MTADTANFVEVWKNHHAPKKTIVKIPVQKKNFKGLKLQSECHRFIDRHVIEIVAMEGLKTERLNIMYKVDNGKVSVG